MGGSRNLTVVPEYRSGAKIIVEGRRALQPLQACAISREFKYLMIIIIRIALSSKISHSDWLTKRGI